jgi:transcriptional regulator with XRE-family HTH domain
MNDGAVVGAPVREARKRIGLTQQELARSSGVSVSLITKLEQGEYGGVRGLRHTAQSGIAKRDREAGSY